LLDAGRRGEEGTVKTDTLWYKDAIFYELHVRTFADSNADGIGDFAGASQKLDYLQDLGITCIWLLPFYQSPLRDDGYDVSDYYQVHPAYGTLADCRNFIVAAHEHGIRVIADLVANHTSDQHLWFLEARSSPHSPKRNYYIWSDSDQKYKEARIGLVNGKLKPPVERGPVFVPPDEACGRRLVVVLG